MPNMGLVLHCKLKYRVWPHAHMGRLRLKIFFTPKLLPKRPHGTKFQQNPSNGGSQHCHEIENLSVKENCFPPLLGQKFNFIPPSGKKNFSPREILHSPLSHLLVHVWWLSPFFTRFSNRQTQLFHNLVSWKFL